MASQIALKSGTNNTGVLSFNGTSDTTLSLPNESGTLATQGYVDGKMVLATSVTASGTAVDFTGIPSWAKRITVMFDGVSTNGTSPLQIQLGTSSGIVTTGYVGLNTIFGSSAVTQTGNFTSGAYLYLGSGEGVTAVRYGEARILNFDAFNYVINGDIGATVTNYSCKYNFKKTLSGALDRIRITTVNGTDTFDAGTINIMYEG